LAAVSFVGFHAVAGLDVGASIEFTDIGSVAAKQMFRTVGSIAQYVVPLALLLGAAVGWLARRNRSGAFIQDGFKSTPTLTGGKSSAGTTGCPVCGAPMVRRQAKRGANAGNVFYGCSKYPACKGTRAA
jgi:hypothetical protein